MVLYFKCNDGRWVKRVFATQCPSKVFMSGKCQGVKGHKGVHWCYKPDGSFAWDDNKKDPQHQGCSGNTPPEHKRYVNPVDQIEKYYLHHYTEEEVTSKTKIAKLEKDEAEKGACIVGPVTE